VSAAPKPELQRFAAHLRTHLQQICATVPAIFNSN
jgi:hypothetical protein